MRSIDKNICKRDDIRQRFLDFFVSTRTQHHIPDLILRLAFALWYIKAMIVYMSTILIKNACIMHYTGGDAILCIASFFTE